MVRRFTINGINHHLAGFYLFHNLQPRKNVLIRSIIHVFPLITAFHEHGLNNAVSLKSFHMFYDFVYGIMPCRTIHSMNIILVYRIKFQYVVIYLIQRIKHCRAVNKGGITQYTDFGIREILITKHQRIFYDFRKMRMSCRLTISGKGQYIRLRSVLLHILQSGFKSIANLFAGRQCFLGTMVCIETAFTINAVE